MRISCHPYAFIKAFLFSYAFLFYFRPNKGVGVCCVFMLLWFPTEKLELICFPLRGEAAVAWPLAAFQMTSNPHSYSELKRLMKYPSALLWRPQGFCSMLQHPKSRCVLVNKCADSREPLKISWTSCQDDQEQDQQGDTLTALSIRTPHAGDTLEGRL